jgi:hypothetical protein
MEILLKARKILPQRRGVLMIERLMILEIG